MTRINVGVNPKELCDQHLIAEYRELPRLWGLQTKMAPPPRFKLGSGHVAWCAQYQGMLADRYEALVAEMQTRGFNVAFPETPPNAREGRRPLDEEVVQARVLVQERILERFKTMKRTPRWTNRLEELPDT